YFIAGRFFYKAWRKRRTYYALTNKRALVLVEGRGRTLRACLLSAVPTINKSVRSSGVGTISFGNTSWASMYDNTGMDFFGARRRRRLGPLHGVPGSIKDLTPTKGIRTTWGSKIFEHHVPDEDALVVARLKAAGAIVLGKTNTPEFGAGANTFNEVFGVTRNPWNPALTPGGSTGGGAVAPCARSRAARRGAAGAGGVCAGGGAAASAARRSTTRCGR